LFSFPPGTEMFHFPGFALSSLCIQPECTSRSRVSGLPHSEIHGSKPVSGSPWLIAAVHVLHRLSSPRHPPRALRSLTISLRRVHGILHPDRPRHARAGQGQDSMHFACRSTTLSESRWRPKAPTASIAENRVAGRSGLTASPKREACRRMLHRKEVIQPQVPLRLPCYDFTPVMSHFLGGCLLAVGAPTSVAAHSHGVTGGVYKARERIHRCLLISDY
jgi:hypothetical protein